MWNILQPSSIHFGAGAASEYDFPERPLLITSKVAKSRGWTEYLKLKKGDVFVTSFHRGRLSMNINAKNGGRADVYHWDPSKELIANSKTKKVIENFVFLGKMLSIL